MTMTTHNNNGVGAEDSSRKLIASEERSLELLNDDVFFLLLQDMILQRSNEEVRKVTFFLPTSLLLSLPFSLYFLCPYLYFITFITSIILISSLHTSSLLLFFCFYLAFSAYLSFAFSVTILDTVIFSYLENKQIDFIILLATCLFRFMYYLLDLKNILEHCVTHLNFILLLLLLRHFLFFIFLILIFSIFLSCFFITHVFFEELKLF